MNDLYVRTRGGVALTRKAKDYREAVKASMAERQIDLVLFPAENKDLLYGVEITIYMPGLENPKWFDVAEEDVYFKNTTRYRSDGPGHKKGDIKNRAGDIKIKKGTRGAKLRYKKVDLDNRVKFLQDCVLTCIGVPDDSQVFRSEQKKVQDPRSRAVVRVYVADRGDFFPGE